LLARPDESVRAYVVRGERPISPTLPQSW
jgi:hypothetical protein